MPARQTPSSAMSQTIGSLGSSSPECDLPTIEAETPRLCTTRRFSVTLADSIWEWSLLVENEEFTHSKELKDDVT